MNILRISNRILKRNGTLLAGVDKYNPLNLSPYTMRVEFYGTDANLDPSTLTSVIGTWTNVSGSIWDWTYENTDWQYDNGRGAMCYYDTKFNLYRNICNNYRFNVLGANTTGVTNMANFFNNQRYIQSIPLFDTSNVTNMNRFLGASGSGSILADVPQFDTSKVTDMSYMFNNCKSLQTVPLFDTSSAMNMDHMFYGCSALTSVPLFSTSSVTNVDYMFYNCRNVESGALALYTQMSTQATPPSSHTSTFTNCGRDTTTGAAELAQIPTSWGGTMS